MILGALVLVGGVARTVPAEAPAPSPPPAPPAQPPRRDAPPIWVPTPMRVDRNREQRPRIETPEDDRPTIIGRGRVPGPDGSFMVGTERVRLAGLTLPERRRLCTGDGGARWACGVRAFATLSGLVVGRELTCRPVSDEAVPGVVRDVVDCRAGARSIVETLVGGGWVEVAPDRVEPTIARLAERTREAKRGIWSDR